MSSIGSTALQTAKQEQQQGPRARSRGQRQRAFDSGTMNMLDAARGAVENAAGQGAALNPMIYQMLGLNPQMQDNSAELAAAQQEYDGLQADFSRNQSRLDQLKGIPPGKRSKQQKKEFKQLKKQVKLSQRGLEDAHARFAQMQTAGQTITGFDRMDPNAIDAQSPFSAQNPLYQAAQTEAQRLNQYMAGGEVDPTLKQQYTAAEAALRAKLSQRFGPDYESTSVGQTALQNFGRERNEAFATWNQSMVERYDALAGNAAGRLQQLMAGQLGLMREPSGNQAGMAGALAGIAGGRLGATQTNQQERALTSGMSGTSIASGFNPGGALGGLLSNPTVQGLANRGWNAMTGQGPAQPGTVNVPPDSAFAGAAGGSELYNWMAGGGGAAGAGTVLAPEAASGALAAFGLG